MAQELQKRSSRADKREEEVHFIVDDEPLWVDAVGQSQTGGHFSNVHKGHTGQQRQLGGAGSPRG